MLMQFNRPNTSYHRFKMSMAAMASPNTMLINVNPYIAVAYCAIL